MKRFTILLLMLLVCHLSFGQQYFCTSVGQQLKYVRRTVSNGKVKWNHIMKIDSVSTLVDGCKRVEYSSDIVNVNDKSRFRQPIKLEAFVDTEGNVTLDVGGTVSAAVISMFKNAEPRYEGSRSSLPVSIKVGDRLPDAEAVVSFLGISLKVSVSERKVVNEENISTPAGSFHCIVVREHKVEKAPLYSRVTTSFTWYSLGVGFVRHDTYNEDMQLETSEVLEAIVLP